MNISSACLHLAFSKLFTTTESKGINLRFTRRAVHLDLYKPRGPLRLPPLSHHLRHIRDNSGIARVVDYVSDKEIHITTVVGAVVVELGGNGAVKLGLWGRGLGKRAREREIEGESRERRWKSGS